MPPYVAGAANLFVSEYYAIATTAVSGSITITATGPTSGTAIVFSVSGACTSCSSPFDTATSGSLPAIKGQAAGTTVSAASFTPATSGDLVIGLVGTTGLGGTFSPGSTPAFTSIASESVGVTSSYAEWYSQPTSASITGSASWTDSQTNNSAMIADALLPQPPPSLSLSPSAGPSGISVTATVGNFNITDGSVSVTSPKSSVLCTISSPSHGAGSCSFPPTNSNGFTFTSGGAANTVTATGSAALDSAQATFTGTVPTITLNPAFGTNVTTTSNTVVLTGAGYAINTLYYYCYESTGTPSGCSVGSSSFTSTGTGGIPTGGSGTELTVNPPANTNQVVVSTTTGSSGVAVASTPFVVTNVAASPSGSGVSTQVTLQGTGYWYTGGPDPWPTYSGHTNASYNVCFQTSPSAADNCASSGNPSGVYYGGSFTVSSPSGANDWGQIPSGTLVTTPATSGTYYLAVYDYDYNGNDLVAVTPFAVTPPTIALSPTQGPTGVTVTVSGNRFAGTDTSVAISGTIVPSTPITCTVSRGSITGTCTFVATGSPGTYTITAVGNQVGGSGDTATATFTITTPTITLTPTSGVVGESVVVTGTGYTGSTTITLTFDSVSISSCTSGSLTASGGKFACTFSVPSGTSGTTVTAAGADVGTVPADTASGTFTVTTPSIKLSQARGPTGVTVTVTGSGFAGTDTSVAISGTIVPSTPITCTVSGGSITGTCTFVATGSPGTYTITAVGNQVGGSGDTATATFTITTPTITLTPSQGPTGVSAVVSGTGFSPGVTITLTISGSGTLGSSSCTGQTVSATGTFTCPATTVSGSAGSYTITATGSDHSTVSSDVASAGFTITTPTITLTPSQGPEGSTVTVSGTGFTIGSSLKSLVFDTVTISSCSPGSMSISGTGTFSCAFSVPSGASGSTVTATDTGGATATGSFTVTVPSIFIVPRSGPSGTVVTVSGTGFTPGATISFSISSGASVTPSGTCQVSSSSGSSDGTFTCSVTVTSSSPANYTLTSTGSDGTFDQASTTYQITPLVLTLSPVSGPSGVTVTVTASGFASTDSTISVKIGTTGLCTITASGGGGSCTFTASSTNGFTFSSGGTANTVTATGSAAGDTAQATFTGTVTSLTLAPSSGPSGVTVTVTAAGFASTDTSIAVTIGSNSLCTITASGGGGTCTFVPTSSNGFTFSSSGASNPVTAKGNAAGDTAQQTFTGTVTALTLSPSQGPSGVTVTVRVTGFASTDTTITVAGPTSVTLCTITVSPSGSGSGSCGFAASAANGFTFSSSGTSNTVTAAGSMASDSATATFTGTMPTLVLSPSSGPSGVTVTVSGSGFASADSHITLSNPTNPSLAVCALSSGTISGTCSFVANSANGFSFSSGGSSVVVTATGNAAGDTQTATFTGTIASLTLSPSQGPSGVTVTVTAAGFASTDTTIAVMIGSTTLCTITASGGGGKCTFVPTSSNGFTFSTGGTVNTVTATGPAAEDVQTATFTGTTPAITVTPGRGPVGSTVTVVGTGFPVNTALASLLFDGVAISSCASGSTTADGAGQFSCQLRVPTGTSGTSVSATASTGQVASGTFTVTTPAIALSPEQGPAGSEVTVAGTGFSTDATLQSLVFDGVAITSCASGSLATTAAGSFDCQFTVPAGTSGTSVVATDPGGATASGTFAVTIPSLSVDPTSGATGATVTASGSGFTVSSSIQFSINNGGTISSATACTTSLTGAFDGCTFSVSGPVHSYTITATDSSHSTATAAYSIVFLYGVTFTESGLPSGTTWTVTVAGNAENSSGSTITFQLQNGTYPYVISDVPGWHQTSLAYTGSVTVKGSSVNEPTLRFAQVTYQVTFSETGIPVGTTWWVNLTTGQSREGTGGSTIIFLEPNGSYVYSVSASPDTNAAPGGTFDVSGAALSILVPFSSTYYSVTFSETGLPTGVQWWVNLTGGPSGSSTSTTLTLSLVNGTWQYTVAAANPSYRAASGSFTVNGAARSVPITFSAYYSVTFTESGLPSGTSWQVTVEGVTQKATAGSSIVFFEPNGSYAYQIGDVSGWHQTAVPYSGTVTVRGSEVTYPTLVFAQVRYSVTFFESGLPAGTLWFVNITNGPSLHGTNSTLVFTEPNGTYGYQVSSSGYAPTPGSGTFTVTGAPAVVGITFVLTTYTVTFMESGLPGGTSWTVAVNGENRSSTSETIVFHEANGTYHFTVYSSNAAYQAKGGSFTVQGNVVVVVVPFFLATYSVVFSESGLPLGTSWSVTFNGTTNRSAVATISFESVNGTFPFTIGGVPGYAANPSSGTVNVRGGSVFVSIDFTVAVYALTFRETGLPSSTIWNVTIDGTVHSSAGSNITVSLPNGTFDYAFASMQYVAEPASGTITIAGTALTVSLTFVAGYTITIHQPSGLANGTVWNVALSGAAPATSARPALVLALVSINETKSSTGPTIAFLEPAGTYTWVVTIAAQPGYFAEGSVSPSAQNPNPVVVPPPVSSGAGGLAGFGALLLAWLPYIAIAIAGALAAFAVLVVAGRRRKRSAAQPPTEEYFEAYLPLPALEPGAPPTPLFEAYVPATSLATTPSAELTLKPEPPAPLLAIWMPEDESSRKASEPSEPRATPAEPNEAPAQPQTEHPVGAKDKTERTDALLEDRVMDDE